LPPLPPRAANAARGGVSPRQADFQLGELHCLAPNVLFIDLIDDMHVDKNDRRWPPRVASVEKGDDAGAFGITTIGAYTTSSGASTTPSASPCSSPPITRFPLRGEAAWHLMPLSAPVQFRGYPVSSLTSCRTPALLRLRLRLRRDLRRRRVARLVCASPSTCGPATSSGEGALGLAVAECTVITGTVDIYAGAFDFTTIGAILARVGVSSTPSACDLNYEKNDDLCVDMNDKNFQLSCPLGPLSAKLLSPPAMRLDGGIANRVDLGMPIVMKRLTYLRTTWSETTGPLRLPSFPPFIA